MTNYLYFASILLVAGCAQKPAVGPSGEPIEVGMHGCDLNCDRHPDTPPSVPTFIEDDYPRALAEANAQHVPIFVDAWASWCHSCVSLKNFVFKDPRIASETRHFVWLAIDTENPKNGDFVAKFPNAVLPTLRVIDPNDEHEMIKWEGTLTAPELVDTLEDVRGGPRNKLTHDSRSADAALMQLALSGDNGACAKMAVGLLGHVPNGTQRVDVAVTGTGCATELPKDQQQHYLPALLDELKQITSDKTLPILADDRSGAYEALVDAGQASGETTAARENAGAWATFLEGEARNAKTPAERAVFDPHRLLAYLALGQPDRAIPMLEQSQRDFPDDFNPPARMARAYFEMGNYDDAITNSDKAMTLANGPRRVKIALLKADALAKKGDASGERKTISDAVAFLGTLPSGEASPKMKTVLEARLAKIDAGAASPKKPAPKR